MEAKKQKTAPVWMLIDTDAGVDDAVAVCMALKLQAKYSYSVKAITCSYGNTSLENVVVNVMKCVEHCARELPSDASLADPLLVSSGAANALEGKKEEDKDASYFHGKDGLGDVEGITVNEEAVKQAHGRDAIQKIIDMAELARSSTTQLKIVTMGPMTNLALAMQKQPTAFSNNPHIELFMMGGCGNGRGNATRVAEFNIITDIPAAALVFREWSSKMLVASWDLSVDFPMPWDTFDTHIGNVTGADAEGSVAGFLAKVCKQVYGNKKERGMYGGAVICDAIALACAVLPGCVGKSQLVNVEVEEQGTICRGQTVVDWGCHDGVSREKKVQWVTELDIAKYSEMLADAMKK